MELKYNGPKVVEGFFMKNVFKGKHFDKVIIIEAVGLYCRFSLSYREVAEILRLMLV